MKIKLKRRCLLLLLQASILAFSVSVFAGGKDDPLLYKVNIDQFEQRNGDEDPFVFEGQAWVGYDLNKFWIKADAERVDGENEEIELQLLYSKAISSFWDFQVGLRRDFEPTPERNWAVASFQGLAPYYIDIEAALFIGESGRTAFRFEAEYELPITQRLVLIPEFEINIFGENDEETGTGSGVSDTEVGLRLAYAIIPEFSPYIGVNWERSYGVTADFARDEGEPTSDVQFVVGFSAWF